MKPIIQELFALDDSPEALELLARCFDYLDDDSKRMRKFKVPAKPPMVAKHFHTLVRKFLRADRYKLRRRAGGGPRKDVNRMTCLMEDATWIGYYFDEKV